MHRAFALVLSLGLWLAASAGFSSAFQTDPALRAFRAGRFDELEDRLSTLVDATRGKHRELVLYEEAIERMAKAIRLDPALKAQVERWREAIRGSARPYHVLAQIELDLAWKARGGGFAHTVPSEAWPRFHAHVKAAKELADRGHEIDPDDLPLAVERITIALLARGGLAAVLARFEEAIALEPTSESAYRAMREALEGRWLGSNEAALTFMREAVRRHPDALALGALLVDTHASIAYTHFPKSEGISWYFRQPEVWNEVLPLAERYVAAHPEDPFGHNWLAWLAWRGGRRDIARREFEILAGDLDESAWDTYFSPDNALAWAMESEP